MSRQDDARRTRETILRVADAAYTECVTAPALQEIARLAGVGRATVYRHFPHRHALATAVVARALGRLERSMTGHPAPPLREVLRAVLSTSLSMRSLIGLLRELPEPEQRRQSQRLVGLLTPAFRCAQAAGELRPDATPQDVLVLLDMLTSRPVTEHPDVTGQHLVDVLLDGLFLRPTGR